MQMIIVCPTILVVLLSKNGVPWKKVVSGACNTIVQCISASKKVLYVYFPFNDLENYESVYSKIDK